MDRKLNQSGFNTLMTVAQKSSLVKAGVYSSKKPKANLVLPSGKPKRKPDHGFKSLAGLAFIKMNTNK